MESLLVVVMVLALVLAVAMILFAWRVLRRDRNRTDARVAQLRTLAQEPELDWSEPDEFPDLTYQASYQASYQGAALFNAHPAPARARWGTLVLVVLVFMGVGAGSVYALYGRDLPIAWPAQFAGTSHEPLELLSLTHRRESGGDFVVTGLVQNPPSGRPAPALVAVVWLFDGNEQYFASGKAAIEVSALAPGDQSPFTIRLSNVGAVSRYRLGFRLGDGGVFAHIDRRGAPMAGTTAALVEEAR